MVAYMCKIINSIILTNRYKSNFIIKIHCLNMIFDYKMKQNKVNRYIKML